LPSITPSYLYSFAAIIAVSGLLVTAFMSYVGGVRFFSETNQLKNIADMVAARATELLTLVSTSNCTIQAYAELPASIGNMQYWLRLKNSSSQAWTEGGFGSIPYSEPYVKAYLPRNASASGFYAAGHGALMLVSSVEDGAVNIHIDSLRGAS